jgi:hypothetical protein
MGMGEMRGSANDLQVKPRVLHDTQYRRALTVHS